MIDALAIRQADTERDPPRYLVHDPGHVAVEVRKRGVRQYRLVAATDVVPDPRRGDVVAVCHRATHGLRVAVMAVSAEDTLGSVLGLNAARELVDHLPLVLPEDAHS